MEDDGLSDRQSTDASDRAVDSRVVLVGTSRSPRMDFTGYRQIASTCPISRARPGCNGSAERVQCGGRSP
jgi:hypothetical protein